MKSDLVDVEAYCHCESASGKAWLVSIENKPQKGHYIPKSTCQLAPRRERQRVYARCGEPVTVTMPAWLAEKIGWEASA